MMWTYCAEFPFCSPVYDRSIRIREMVLREPLGLSFSADELAGEWQSRHLGLFRADDLLLACLVLLPVDPSTWKMRQVAVLPEYQGKGIGRGLVGYSEQVTRTLGGSELILHARQTAVDFYLGLGYGIYGNPFVEVGIPHRSMRKSLTA